MPLSSASHLRATVFPELVVTALQRFLSGAEGTWCGGSFPHPHSLQDVFTFLVFFVEQRFLFINTELLLQPI